MANLKDLWKDQRGQDFTEYALIGGLVACVSVGLVPEMIEIASHINSLVLSAVQACAELATLK